MAELSKSDGGVVFGADLDEVDQQLNVICDSSTRPTGAEGRLISVTDLDRMEWHTGTAWTPVYGPWRNYTPAWTNVTVGDGTVTARWCWNGQDVKIEVTLVFGSTTSISNAPKVSLPVTATSAPKDGNIHGQFVDATGPTAYPALHNAASTTTTGFIYAVNTAGTYAVAGTVSGSAPFTFTTGDKIEIWGEYTP